MDACSNTSTCYVILDQQQSVGMGVTRATLNVAPAMEFLGCQRAVPSRCSVTTRWLFATQLGSKPSHLFPQQV